MVKISKVQLSHNVRRSDKNVARPKFLNVITLAEFSGAEVYEKSKTNLITPQDTLSLFGLQQKLEKFKDEFKDVIKKSFPNVTLTGYSIPLDLKEHNINQSLLSQLRTMRLMHKNYLKDITAQVSDKIRVPYLNKLCSDIPEKQFFTILHDSLIMSPRFLVHYIKGEHTVSHYTNVKKFKNIYSSCSVEKLFGIKRRIINEFCEYTNTESLIPDYKFSKAQIKRLKLLAEKYYAIDDLLQKHNIHTAAIEALFHSGIEKCTKPGDILPNKDIMLGFSAVYDRQLKKNIPVILSFASTDLGYRFKAYRYEENFISNIEKYKKLVSYSLRTKNYNLINDLDNKILKYLKNIEVAEVYAELKDMDGLRKEMARCPDMTEEKIADALNSLGNDTVYYIKNLKNYDINRYYNASAPLIKCLNEFGRINNINEAYTEALAFNNVQHSPVGMYIRCGFEPISVSKEEIEKDLHTKNGFDYKRSVWLVYKL